MSCSLGKIGNDAVAVVPQWRSDFEITVTTAPTRLVG